MKIELEDDRKRSEAELKAQQAELKLEIDRMKADADNRIKVAQMLQGTSRE